MVICEEYKINFCLNYLFTFEKKLIYFTKYRFLHFSRNGAVKQVGGLIWRGVFLIS